MTHAIFIVRSVVQFGRAWAEHIVRFVIRHLIPMVVLTIIGLITVIRTQSISTLFFSGMGFGIYVGITLIHELKQKNQTLWMKEIEALEAKINSFSKGQSPPGAKSAIATAFLIDWHQKYGWFAKSLPLSAQIPLEPRLYKRQEKYPRSEDEERITRVLRYYLEPFHCDGDDTYLRIKQQDFTYDKLASTILYELGLGDDE